MACLWLGDSVFLLQLIEGVCFQFASLDCLVEYCDNALLHVPQTGIAPRLCLDSHILLRYIVILQPKKECFEPCLIELHQSDMRSAFCLQELLHAFLKVLSLLDSPLGIFGIAVHPLHVGLDPVNDLGRIIIWNVGYDHQVTFLGNGLGMKDALGTNLLRTFQGSFVAFLCLLVNLRD